MIHPQEIEVWYVLPGVRKEIAANLIAKGWSQRQVAQKLGVTEAAVSQYVNHKRADHQKLDFPAEFKAYARQVSDKIAVGELDTFIAIQMLMREFRKCGGLCQAHKAIDPKGIPEGCEVCLQ